MAAKKDLVMITCEHGGNRIPARYRALFRGHLDLLRSHRGYDAGALTMAQELATAFNAPLFVATISRLLIDLNRSIGHPRLYSEASRVAPKSMRHEILQRHYLPYRDEVEALVAAYAARGHRVIHVSSHTFTPVLNSEVRNADIGLLYDPARKPEARLCARWHTALRQYEPALRVRRNYPYTGKSDGFTAYLRRRFPASKYVGIELEINQEQVLKGGRQWRALRRVVVESLRLAASGRQP